MNIVLVNSVYYYYPLQWLQTGLLESCSILRECLNSGLGSFLEALCKEFMSIYVTFVPCVTSFTELCK